MPQADNNPQQPQVPSLKNLFISFVTISLLGFGGTVAWARRMAVDERRWMTAGEFNETFALCQFLPGPNVANFAVVFGARVRGIRGAFTAAAGLIAPSLCLMIILGLLYTRFQEFEALQRVLGGVSTAAAGLIFGTAARMAQPLFRSGQWHAPLIVLAALIAVGILRIPMWWALATLIPLGVGIAWRSAR
ncbi:MAG: chromate transporter [Alphaproteobacteria bacterium]|jgi:chromate transporter|nr:chromate transporter [Alphaproteobacteria bacterium]